VQQIRGQFLYFAFFDGYRQKTGPDSNLWPLPMYFFRHGLIMVLYQLSYLERSMSVATIKLSSKGQIVIPKEIQDELHWQAGTQLSLVGTGSGVLLNAMPAKMGRSLRNLIGYAQARWCIGLY